MCVFIHMCISIMHTLTQAQVHVYVHVYVYLYMCICACIYKCHVVYMLYMYADRG